MRRLIASLLLFLLVIQVRAQDSFTIGAVKRTGVHAGGIDILEQNPATGSKTGAKDIFFVNTQMGGQQFKQTAQCITLISAHSCQFDLDPFYPINFMNGWTVKGMTGPSFGQTATITAFVPGTNTPKVGYTITTDSGWTPAAQDQIEISGEFASQFACSVVPMITITNSYQNGTPTISWSKNDASAPPAYADGDQTLTPLVAGQRSYNAAGWGCTDNTAAYPTSTYPAGDPTVTYAQGATITAFGLKFQSLQNGNLNHMPKPSSMDAQFWGGTLPTDTWWKQVGTVFRKSTDIPSTTVGISVVMDTSCPGEGVTCSGSMSQNGSPTQTLLVGPYALGVSVKRVSGPTANNGISSQRTGVANGYSTPFLPFTAAPLGSWYPFVYNFTAAESSATAETPNGGSTKLSIAGSGSVLILKDAYLQEVNAANTTPYRTATRDVLAGELKGTATRTSLRYMDSQKNTFGCSVHNLLTVKAARERCLYGPRDWYNGGTAMGINEHLMLADYLGSDPWIDVATSTQASEYQELLEYMFGDSTTVGGAERIAQGHPATFDTNQPGYHVVIEMGNEVWNDANPGQLVKGNTTVNGLIGSTYAAWLNNVLTQIHAMPIYQAHQSQIEFGASGWEGTPLWNTNVVNAACGNIDSIDGAAYQGISLNQTGTNTEFSDQYANPDTMAYQGTLSSNLNWLNQIYNIAQTCHSSRPVKIHPYEMQWSPGSRGTTVPFSYFNGAVNGMIQAINNSMTHLLLTDRFADDYSETFAMNGSSSGAAYLCAAGAAQCNPTTVDGSNSLAYWGNCQQYEGPQGRICRPAYFAEAITYAAYRSNLHTVTPGAGNTTFVPTGYNGTDSGIGATPYIQCFAFSSDGTAGTLSLLLYNRDQVAHTVTLAGIMPTGAVARSQLYSSSAYTNNETSEVVVPVVDSVNATSTYTLQPNSITALASGSVATINAILGGAAVLGGNIVVP